MPTVEERLVIPVSSLPLYKTPEINVHFCCEISSYSRLCPKMMFEVCCSYLQSLDIPSKTPVYVLSHVFLMPTIPKKSPSLNAAAPYSARPRADGSMANRGSRRAGWDAGRAEKLT